MRGVRVAYLTAISHLSRLIVGLLTLKLIAINLGPEGLGFLGNYMSMISIATALAGGGIITGVIKYIAEFSDDPQRQGFFIGSSLIYGVFFSAIVGIVGVFFIKPITLAVFTEGGHGRYVALFLLAQIFAGISNIGYGVLNGLQKNATYAAIVIAGSAISILIAYFCIKAYGMAGAVVALTAPIVVPSVFIVFALIRRRSKIKIAAHYVASDCRKLSAFTLMLLTGTICFPIVEMYLRNRIQIIGGFDMVGIWQAVMRLSSAYLSFFSLFLSFYLVPLVSSTNDRRKILRLVLSTMVLLTTFFILMFLIVWQMKSLIVEYVFSSSFASMADYLLLQMLGDYFKVMSWVIGFVVVAKAATKIYVGGEILQGAMFVGIATMLLSHKPAIVSVVSAYTSTAALYLLICICGFWYFIVRRQTANHMDTI